MHACPESKSKTGRIHDYLDDAMSECINNQVLIIDLDMHALYSVV
jgi:hypothetical protein